MVPRSWQGRLGEANSYSDVVAVARTFVATLSDGDIERLPAHCRPGKLDSREDVQNYARLLVGHHCAGDAATERLVSRLAEFFSAASIRLAALPA